jgi:hypothetical protein
MRLMAPDGTREWLAVRDYATRLTEADFTAALWPQEHDDKTVYAHLVRTWVRKLGPCQVLIVKLSPDAGPEQTRYWVTSCLDDTLEQVIAHVAQRWTIETLFADFKELLGSDHYQVRSAQGIVRFWTLGLCLYQFLDEICATHQRYTGVRLTLGQVRQQIREVHAAQLLDWICDQAEKDVSRDDIRLALQPAMRL